MHNNTFITVSYIQRPGKAALLLAMMLPYSLAAEAQAHHHSRHASAYTMPYAAIGICTSHVLLQIVPLPLSLLTLLLVLLHRSQHPGLEQPVMGMPERITNPP
jgi:uncharacterized membrane protein YdjX (TVP38/TMEM64 family)